MIVYIQVDEYPPTGEDGGSHFQHSNDSCVLQINPLKITLTSIFI
jgi:hypothetical protein